MKLDLSVPLVGAPEHKTVAVKHIATMTRRPAIHDCPELARVGWIDLAEDTGHMNYYEY